MPEADLIKKLWPKGKASNTAAPEVKMEAGKLVANSETAGATIGYKLSRDSKTWKVYDGPVSAVKGDTIQFIADRIGYRPSEVVVHVQ